MSAGHYINFASQRNSYASVKEGIKFFTYGKATNAQKPNQETGIRLHAASGKVSSQSQAGETWLTNRARPRQSSVVEAKASMNPASRLLSLLGEAKGAERSPALGTGRKKNRSREISTHAGTAPINGAKSGMVMQMSRTWILDRIDSEFSQYKSGMTRGGTNYSRHVFLVSPLQASDHMIAMEKIISDGLINNPAAAQKYAPEHNQHNIHKEFGERDLDAAEAQYKISGKPKKPKKPKK